jgi:hypothetical protein
MFFFKRKTIVIDCLTSDIGIYTNNKIETSNNYMPDWWKSYPRTRVNITNTGLTHDFATIKRCDGIIEYYKNSITLPLWSDLIIETRKDGGWAYKFAADAGAMGAHVEDQFSGLLDNHFVMKMETPWIFVEKTGINFFMMHPTWNSINTIDTLHIPPGMLNFKEQHGVSINLFLKKVDRKYELPHKYSMAHLIPITENKIEVRNHLVDQKEYDNKCKMSNYKTSFIGSYKSRMKNAKDEPKKCPFGFGR